MRGLRYVLLFVCLGFLMGCSVSSGTPTPNIAGTTAFEDAMAGAVAATLQALETRSAPIHPRSPLYIANLLDPGDFFEGMCAPGSVQDLIEPYPVCGFYGGCWEEWPGPADFGAELDLSMDGRELGSIVYLFYEDKESVSQIYQAYYDRYSRAANDYYHSPEMAIWMPAFNPFQTEGLGERSVHDLSYVLVGEDDLEVLEIKLLFTRCNGIVIVKMMFPTPTSATNPEHRSLREDEQRDVFLQVFEFAQNLEARTVKISCPP